MTLEFAIRLSEVMLALAMIQQAGEHLRQARGRALFVARISLCLMLLAGLQPGAALLGLFLSSLVHLWRYGGPYNGGSDKMTILIVTCLMVARLGPNSLWAELAMSYLAVQLVLSYFVSGYVKIVKAEWRSGQALVDVFTFSAYPVSESLRGWAKRPRLLQGMSWGVMGFEVLFPLALLHPIALFAGLAIAATFHLANAFLFGLNRFFWIWICAYPSLIWFQGRVFG
ncbi:MAG: HTTM domain-containing protein [Cognatishimia sp.]|uniref:HTTM domain-containing protein n=1 Tax=Cognatishimia sp. TaxID=2211648 RepID=UPI00405A19E3